MTDRERILAAVRGDPVDRMPWVPRLEFWYRGRLRKGTLPENLRGLTLHEVADQLGVGHYGVVPDFLDSRDDPPNADRTLGLYSPQVAPHTWTFDGVERRSWQEGHETVVEYRTSAGTLRTAHLMTEEMKDAGTSVEWITRHAIEGPGDFEIVGEIFSRLRVVPQYAGYLARREQMGDKGIVVGFIHGAACPMHHIMKELMKEEQFFYAMADYPEKVAALAERMAPFYEGIRQAAADSPAEVVHLGGNYDDSITYPRFFAQHILPALREYGEQVHRKGKYLLTHTDGENRRLFPLYREAGFDVADSVCPYPMTQCRLEDVRAGFGDRIAIWGGIPSVLLCSDSASWEDFRSFIDNLLARYGHDTRFILGVSDMVTVDCEWERLGYITEQVNRLA